MGSLPDDRTRSNAAINKSFKRLELRASVVTAVDSLLAIARNPMYADNSIARRVIARRLGMKKAHNNVSVNVSHQPPLPSAVRRSDAFDVTNESLTALSDAISVESLGNISGLE
jgi:hypothetical protein